MARRRSRRTGRSRKVRKYPRRSSSARKSAVKKRGKWKKTKRAVATLATIAVAFGLYKWYNGRKIPDTKAARTIVKQTKPAIAKNYNLTDAKVEALQASNPGNVGTYYKTSTGQYKPTTQKDTADAVLAGVKARKSAQSRNKKKGFYKGSQREFI